MDGFEAALNDIGKLDEMLRSDVKHWTDEIVRGNSSQLAYRSFARSLFSLVEGLSFSLKRIAIETGAKYGHPLSEDEVFAAREKQLDLDDSGELKVRPMPTRLKPNLRFAFRILAQVYGASFSLDVSGEGWQAFARCVKVRDRITHPKSPGDAMISESEIQDFGRATIWFNESFDKLFQAIVAEQTRHRDALLAERDDLEFRRENLERELEEFRGHGEV